MGKMQKPTKLNVRVKHENRIVREAKKKQNNFSDHLMNTRTKQGYFFRIVYNIIINYYYIITQYLYQPPRKCKFLI
jgi:hypothetical protein